MDDGQRACAEGFRSRLELGLTDASSFRAALLDVPPIDRDAWLDLVLGLGEPPPDDPELPRGCVPYLPCAVEPLLRVVEQAPVNASDVFVDVGAGLGRAAALVHLLTGAEVIGVEVQPTLVRAARELAQAIRLEKVAYVEGDAAEIVRVASAGTVFFFYCPFSGERLAKVLAALESAANRERIRVCAVDLPLPECPWLTLDEQASTRELCIYRSTPNPAP